MTSPVKRFHKYLFGMILAKCILLNNNCVFDRDVGEENKKGVEYR